MATTEETATQAQHGGRLVAQALRSRGVEHLFTLSGGHLFSIYDGCKEEGIEIVDVRHEQAAVWAAEGYAKATRKPGVAALTAGPGVTNGMSAIAGAFYNRSPITVLGGRAPEMRWGSGSLQEIDHVPFVEPLVKSAETVKDTAEIAARVAEAIDLSMAHPSGPTFLDFPLDTVFNAAEAEPGLTRPSGFRAPGLTSPTASRRPQSSWPRPSAPRSWPAPASTGRAARTSCARSPRRLGAPVFLNGMGRGCLPADHELAFSRARGHGLKEADVALAIGLPLDFRLGFGGSFGEDTKLVWLDAAPNELDRNRKPDVELVGGIAPTLAAIREAAVGRRPVAHRRLGRGRSRDRGREARRRAGGARRRPRPASPDARSTRSLPRCSTATRS